MLYFTARFSAVIPIDVKAPGATSAIRGFGIGLNPVIGIRDIDSIPPAMKHSPEPIAIRPTASCMACMLEPQKRLTVTPGTESGNSVRKVSILARLNPCSASGKAVPTIKSSTRSGLTSSFLSSPLTTAAAMSSGRVRASFPFRAGVKGERA